MDTESVSNETSLGNDSSLQNEMTGNFFDYDDGLGAVVDQNGEPFSKSDGKYFTSLDEYKSSLGNRQQSVKPAQSVQGTQSAIKTDVPINQPIQEKNSFDSFYKNEKGFDISSILNDGQTFINSKPYQRETNPYNTTVNNGQLEAKQTAPVDPKLADANSLKEYRDSLENSALKPLERAYNSLVEFYAKQGSQLPVEVYNSLNAEYSQLKTAIDEAVTSKKEELFENRFKSEKEQSRFEEVAKKSVENFSTVSSQFFPNLSKEQSEQKLSKLIFGFTDGAGKFTRGYGADIVDHAFDIANDGKVFNTKEEWADAYNKWWSKYASNPKNLEYIAQRSWDRFISSSINNIRDGFRSTWENEQREKLKQSQINPSVSRGNSILQSDNQMKELDNYFAPPSRHM